MSGDAQKSVFHCAAGGAAFQGAGCVESKQAAFVNDRDAICEELHFGERVGSEEQRSMAALHNFGFDEAAEFGGGQDIETACGFVQQQHVRLVQYGAGEAQALDHPRGKSANLPVEGIFEVKSFRESVDAMRGCGFRELVQSPKEHQVLPACQAGIKTVVGPRVVAQLAADGARIPRGVVPRDTRAAPGGKQERGQNFQQRGFARAVGSQERHGFAVSNVE